MLPNVKNPDLPAQKKAARELLETRYHAVRNFLKNHKDNPNISPLPFNSGYFMSFHCKTVSAETLRQSLLHDFQIGTIAIDNETLRVAFSSLDVDQINIVYSAIYKAAEQLVNA